MTPAELRALIPETCPKCSCPMWNERGFATADGHSAWQDTDGTWYNGPSRQATRRSCAHCGWAQNIVKKSGKLESVEEA